MELSDLRGKRNDAEVTRELIYDETKQGRNFERSPLTRFSCITALCVSWVIALGCIFGGTSRLSRAAANGNLGWLAIDMNARVKQVLPLLFNVIVTILTEGLGLIHATTLRWALKDRLTFNSNLRLFTRAPEYWAFGRISNFFNAGFLALLYCATSVILADVPTPWICDKLSEVMVSAGGDVDCSGGEKTYVSPSAILALGIGLLGKCAISTWQLSIMPVPTWSTSPVETAWACIATHKRTRVEGRCMMSVHESREASHAKRPQQRQSFAWSANAEIRRVLIYLWVLVALGFIFFGAILQIVKKLYTPCTKQGGRICGAYEGSSWSLIPDVGGMTSLVQIQTISTIHGTAPETVGEVAVGMLVTFMFLMAVQSLLTMGLHCAELLVNTSRDEYVWRSTSTKKGYTAESSITTIAKSPKSILLLGLKPIVHWLYGLSLTYYYRWGTFIHPPQLLYLSLSLLILASFGTVLCFVRPQGPQPATFGHVRTLVDLIDEYGDTLYWGHKSTHGAGFAHAGTATKPLPRVNEMDWYAGEKDGL